MRWLGVCSWSRVSIEPRRVLRPIRSINTCLFIGRKWLTEWVSRVCGVFRRSNNVSVVLAGDLDLGLKKLKIAGCELQNGETNTRCRALPRLSSMPIERRQNRRVHRSREVASNYTEDIFVRDARGGLLFHTVHQRNGGQTSTPELRGVRSHVPLNDWLAVTIRHWLLTVSSVCDLNEHAQVGAEAEIAASHGYKRA